MMKRRPPYGRELNERLKWGNRPFFVAVCIGLDAWKSARSWNGSPNDIAGLVCPDNSEPSEYVWDVSGSQVIIERRAGPDDKQVLALVRELLRSGAEQVIVWDPVNKMTTKFWAEL